MIIYNAAIYTQNNANTVIANGFIEFGEKIKSVGIMADCPPVTGEDYDAEGLTVYPGFIDAHCHVGVWENASGFEGDDGNEVADPCAPHLRAIDMINPKDLCFEEAAKAGVTTVCAGPGSANPISGTFLVMKTWGSPRIDKRTLLQPAAVKFAFGENPKHMYFERDESPKTRMATAAVIREQLYKARKYAADKDEYYANKGGDNETSLPDYDIKCEALIPLLRGETPMHAHCHRADDIFTAIRIAREFDLNITLIHATDAAEITSELTRENIPVILGPVICDRGKPELVNHSIATPAALAKKGVRFAICTDHPVTPVQYLPLSAGLAIRGGLSEERALRAITADAAAICGISDRAGCIEAGKDADFTVFKGRFYEVTETPQAVFIDGNRIV